MQPSAISICTEMEGPVLKHISKLRNALYVYVLRGRNNKKIASIFYKSFFIKKYFIIDCRFKLLLLNKYFCDSSLTAHGIHQKSFLRMMLSETFHGLCLLFAVSLCSSAAVVFDILTSSPSNVNPFLAASWRLSLQTVLQLPFFLRSRYVTKRLDEETLILLYHSEALELKVDQLDEHNEKSETRELLLPRYYKSLPLCAVSGIFLGVHFSMWVFSLRYTSISHSLLWVSMGPIVLNCGSWFMYSISRLIACMRFNAFVFQPPSHLETFGAFIGIGGACIMMISVANTANISNDTMVHPPTLYGDLSAFSGAVAVCIYLIIGSKLRSFLPLWLYVFPVIAFSSLTCLVFALVDEQSNIVWNSSNSSTSVFGFMSAKFFPSVLYLAVGPGIGGHTLINALLRHVSPMVISTAMLGEPIIGSLIGYFVGVQPLPGIFTFLGGFILLAGLVLVVIGENIDEKKRNESTQVISRQTCDNGKNALRYGSFQDDAGCMSSE
jgi:drug/metabolite transporter (DMT)-like permease